MEAIRKCEKEIKGLKSELSDSRKQSNKALKKVETLEREMRQIKTLLEGRETSSGASLKPRLSDESDVRQQVCRKSNIYVVNMQVIPDAVINVYYNVCVQRSLVLYHKQTFCID